VGQKKKGLYRSSYRGQKKKNSVTLEEAEARKQVTEEEESFRRRPHRNIDVEER
jgi:hypothetical protein